MTTLSPQPAYARDNFGAGTALSRDGRTLVVSSPNDPVNPDTGEVGDVVNDKFGALNVFTRGDNGAWQVSAYLKPPTNRFSHDFGVALAISGDGNTIAVGSPNDTGRGAGIGSDPRDRGPVNIGAVFVYVRDGTSWRLQAYFKPPVPDVNVVVQYGRTVALSDDGRLMAVGTEAENSGARGIDGDPRSTTAPSSGAVWVYERDSGDTWHQRAYLKASNAEAGDVFGRGLAISGDGRTVAVGATGEASAASDINGNQNDNSLPQVGAVYVFARDDTGRWSQTAYVKAYENFGRNQFGTSVAIDASGTLLAVGAPQEAGTPRSSSVYGPGAQLDIGRAYLFRRASAGWARSAALTASNAGIGDNFGDEVVLSRDGQVLAVGAPREDGGSPGVNGNQQDDSQFNSGAVYLFSPISGATDWQQTAYVKSPQPCECALIGENFRHGLALDGSGRTLALGDPERADGAGRVYVYE